MKHEQPGTRPRAHRRPDLPGPGTGHPAHRLSEALLAALLASATPALGDEVVRNWFKDPFFQVRNGVADCPMPLGPYVTESQRLHEAHYRSERGLRCYLEKKCTKPSSYMYDADIAASVRARFETNSMLRDSTLWITVQRRFVWVEGCVAGKDGQRRIEALLHDVPDMERLVVFAWNGRSGAPPYRVLQPGQRRED